MSINKRLATLIILFIVISGFTCSGNPKVRPTEETKTTPDKGSTQEAATSTESPTTGQKLQQAINDLAQEIKNSISDGGFHKAAVVPLTTLRGGQTDLGLYFSDKLTSMLSGGSSHLEMVERSKINAALAEIKLGESGLLDEETIQKTGKALGVDAVIVGTITDLGQEVDINVRIFSVSTLKILGKASQLLPKDGVVKSLLYNIEPDQQGVEQTKKTEDNEINKTGKYLFYDDFTSPDFSRYQVSDAGMVKFNPEEGMVEVNTGDNHAAWIQLDLDREIQSGLIEVEFMTTIVYPYEGAVAIYALTSAKNGYCFLYPTHGNEYKTRLAKVVSNKELVLGERAGDTYSLNQDHKISLGFDPSSIKGSFDDKIIYNMKNDTILKIKQIRINIAEMNAYIKSLKVLRQ